MKIISEHKKIRRMRKDGQKATPVKPGMKRVMASENGRTYHIDVPR